MSKDWLQDVGDYGGELMEYFVQRKAWTKHNKDMCIPSSVFWIRHVLKHAAPSGDPAQYRGFYEHIREVAPDPNHEDYSLTQGLLNRAMSECDYHLTTWETLAEANSTLDQLLNCWPGNASENPEWQPTSFGYLNYLGYLLATNRGRWPDRVTERVAALNLPAATSFFERFREYYCSGTTDGEFQRINRRRVAPPFDELICHEYLGDSVLLLSLGRLPSELHFRVDFGPQGAIKVSAFVEPANSTDTFSLICIYNARRVRESLIQGSATNFVGHMMAFRHGGDHVVFFDPNSGSVRFPSFQEFRDWFRKDYWVQSGYATFGDSGFVKRFR